MLDGVADQFDHEHRLAHPGPAEEANLAPPTVGGEQVNDLEAGGQHLGGGFLLPQRRGIHVNGLTRRAAQRQPAVYRLAQHVEDAAQGGPAHRHHDRLTGVLHRQSPTQPRSRSHSHTAHRGGVNVLLHLDHQGWAFVALDEQRMADARQVAHGELHIHYHARHAHYVSNPHCHLFSMR